MGLSRAGRPQKGARRLELLCHRRAHLLHGAARIQEGLVYFTYILERHGDTMDMRTCGRRTHGAQGPQQG